MKMKYRSMASVLDRVQARLRIGFGLVSSLGSGLNFQLEFLLL